MKTAKWILLLFVSLFAACGQADSPTTVENTAPRQTAEALAQHAELLLVTPNPFLAMGDLMTAIALDPTEARYYLDLGMAHYYAAGYEQAVAAFNKVLELDPQQTTAYYFRGQAAYAMENYDLALESYQQAWDLGTCDSVMVEQMITIYQQRGDLDEVNTVQNRAC